ncbi:hypothetical protein PLICRDRAFT_47364 [Plicaturopsis crispa FD-325 SS-3]|uniref:Uncharacterized protein n=1 Tax=Plicaturopsis crispa FD-325 SS-3 TaxID=944288 RepID=A0A0C9T5E5_PLICR|nr:hypothetical protein PLICRDRAFT_47364 [Plicaturopsis crispa FD-325 SS-3]
MSFPMHGRLCPEQFRMRKPFKRGRRRCEVAWHRPLGNADGWEESAEIMAISRTCVHRHRALDATLPSMRLLLMVTACVHPVAGNDAPAMPRQISSAGCSCFDEVNREKKRLTAIDEIEAPVNCARQKVGRRKSRYHSFKPFEAVFAGAVPLQKDM